MSLELPATQRAWVAVAKGTPAQALRLKEDWPVPKDPRPGEILLKVQAAALNPVGYKMLKLLPNFIAGRPRVAEFDLAGVVVDSNSPKFKAGDEVYGWIPAGSRTKQGALAQYASWGADHFVTRPSNITPTEAAGITLTSQTAYESVVVQAKVKSGQRVLINGGSTAVGAYAIQLAKSRGAHVTATASAKNEEFVRRMGADEFIDYTKVDLVKHLKEQSATSKYDLILEAVGFVDPSLYTNSEAYLNKGGCYHSVGPQPKLTMRDMLHTLRLAGALTIPGFLGGVKRRISIILVKNYPERLDAVRTLIAEGTLKPIVDSVFEFDDVLKAYERLMSSRATGKVTVKVDPSA